MRGILWIRVLFFVAAVYDGVLGLVFLIAPRWMFDVAAVTPPNHNGYVQFPALILIIFAVMFAVVGIEPARNRNLIPYGIGLKVAYAGIVVAYWVSTGIPDMWKPFAVIDAVMAVLFAWSYFAMSGEGQRSTTTAQ